MKLLIKESYNASNCFYSIDNPDRIASNWIGPTKVGKVSINDYMRYEKGQDATVTYMTAKEYLINCAKAKRTSYDAFIRGMDKGQNLEDISDYANDMKNGDKFPIPYVDFTSNQQEGRHRALAVEKAFGPEAKFPVIVITPTQPTEDELVDYAKRRWGEDNAIYFLNELNAKYFPQIKDNIDNAEQDEIEQSNLDNLDDIDNLDIDLDDFDILSDNSYNDKFTDYIDDYMSDNNIDDNNIDFIIASMNKWDKLSDEQKAEIIDNKNKLYDLLDKVIR